jgi:hypothetical protein
MYCPPWIFDICVARVASEFLYSELSLTPFAIKYSKGLSSLYEPVETEKLETIGEGLLQFLTEIDAGESAADFLRHYTYFKLYFETNNVKRKLSPLFGSIEDPVKNMDFSEDKAQKNFRAFVFSLRSNTIEMPPDIWALEKDENLPKLNAIITQEVSVLDIF